MPQNVFVLYHFVQCATCSLTGDLFGAEANGEGAVVVGK